MSELAIEDHVYDFLRAAIDAAQRGEPLFGAELHDHVFRKIEKEYGVRVGDADSDLAPSPGATEMREFDGFVPLVIFSVVKGANQSDRQAARTRMIELSKAVSKLFHDDPTMGGRVNDARITRWPRGWDSIEARPYSVSNAVLLVNETGGPVGQ
jgi:hypothetical protein